MSIEPGNVYCMDALDGLRHMADGSIDAVITDPPYAEIDRDYGRMSEGDWLEYMQACVVEFRRVLKSTGSAVMVLQPNSVTPGTMRMWMWKFLVWCGEYWNVVQDAYWWNFATPPTIHTHRDIGLMRPSVKTLVWIGNVDCYRNQDAVLWTPSDAMMAEKISDRALQTKPSGLTIRPGRVKETVIERGGTTPFNLLPIANANSSSSAGSMGHGAGTPAELVRWWLKYISMPGDVVIDPFMGTGTTAVEALHLGRQFIGFEKMLKYADITNRRLANWRRDDHVEVAPGVIQMGLFTEASS